MTNNSFSQPTDPPERHDYTWHNPLFDDDIFFSVDDWPSEPPAPTPLNQLPEMAPHTAAGIPWELAPDPAPARWIIEDVGFEDEDDDLSEWALGWGDDDPVDEMLDLDEATPPAPGLLLPGHWSGPLTESIGVGSLKDEVNWTLKRGARNLAAAVSILASPPSRASLRQGWRVTCPPSEVLDAVVASPGDDLGTRRLCDLRAQVVAEHLEDCGDCRRRVDALERAVHKFTDPEPLELILASFEFSISRDMAFARDASLIHEGDPRSECAVGERHISGLVDMGIHPRLTWQLCADTLTIRAAPQRGPLHDATLVASVRGGAAPVPFVEDASGDLVARLSLSESQRARPHVTLVMTRSEPAS